MPLTTNTELIAAIGRWMNRRDLDAVIPEFIALNEARLNRDLRVREMVVRDQVVTPPGADEVYENLPADFLEMKGLRFNGTDYDPPEYVTPQYMEVMRTRYRGQSGVPKFYTIIGDQLLFERVPTGQNLEIASYVRIPPLGVATVEEPSGRTQNAILLNYPDLYLFGALSQSAPYIDDDERLATWEARFGNALDMANAASVAAEMSPGPLKMRTRVSF